MSNTIKKEHFDCAFGSVHELSDYENPSTCFNRASISILNNLKHSKSNLVMLANDKYPHFQEKIHNCLGRIFYKVPIAKFTY